MANMRFPRLHFRMLVAALPFVAAFVVYVPSLHNGFTMIDDGLLIFENNLIRTISPQTLRIIFTSYDPELYIPLTFFSYQLDYLIGGYHPLVYHVTNTLLHAGNAIFVMLFISLLIQQKNAAILCGVLFALHPLHTEAVAWVAARKDILSSFFFLGSLVAYSIPLYKECSFRAKRIAFGLSVFLFFLALLAKVSVLSLPLVLFALHLLRGDHITKRVIVRLMPFFLLSTIFGVVALGGKSALILETTTMQLLLLACKTTVFSLYKILFPFRASLFYPELHSITFQNSIYLAAIIIVIALACLLWKFRARKELLFGALFFFATLTPSFLAINKGGNTFFFSDRYAYLPSIGIIIIIFSIVQHWRISSTVFRPIIGFLISIFTLLTIHQSLLWGNPMKLFAQATAAYPDFYLSHIDLGAALREEGKLDEALIEFRTAISLHALPNTYGLIGQIKAEQGKYTDAVKEFESGLALLPTDPELLYGLGQVYALMGESEKAMSTYEQALAVTKDESSAYRMFARRISARRDMIFLRMGILAGASGKHEEAVALYERALIDNPSNAEAHYNLAVGLGNLHRPEETLHHYEETVRLDPYHIQALVNLGILYERAGRRVDAVRKFREVLNIDPTNPVVQKALQSLGMN